MKPFKMFFGIAVGAILLFFVARIFVIAFVIAAAMSIIYAVYRKLKDFASNNNHRTHRAHYGINQNWQNEVEPLFVEYAAQHRTPVNNTRVITAI